jgi:hypothetical protein
LGWMNLYPMNPKKPGSISAGLSHESHQGPRTYQPASELERKLEAFCHQRPKAVGLAIKMENQFCCRLKEYYPVALDPPI